LKVYYFAKTTEYETFEVSFLLNLTEIPKKGYFYSKKENEKENKYFP